jgi:hypothetical protein
MVSMVRYLDWGMQFSSLLKYFQQDVSLEFTTG